MYVDIIRINLKFLHYEITTDATMLRTAHQLFISDVAFDLVNKTNL